MPKEVYLDPAGEFRAEEVMDHFQGHNVRLFTTAAAWQRGRLERHGDVLKSMLERLDNEKVIANTEEFDQALVQCCQAKNALIRYQGYSPEQLVLGKAIALPGSICSLEDLSSHALADAGDLEAERHRQRLELRCRARQAFFAADNCMAIRRASLRRSNPVRGPYQAGDWVLYWIQKSNPNRLQAGKWHGPAKVICQEGQSIVWLSHGMKILRCPPEILRLASLREWQLLNPEEGRLDGKAVGGVVPC